MGSARREVVWKRESLGGGLRGMRMGRVSSGRTRVTVNSTNILGYAFQDGREKMRSEGYVWTLPRDGPL